MSIPFSPFHPDELYHTETRIKQIVCARERIKDSQWCCLFSFLLALFLSRGAVRVVLAAGFLFLDLLLHDMSAVLVIGRAETKRDREKREFVSTCMRRPGSNRCCRRRWHCFKATLLIMLIATVLGYGATFADGMAQGTAMLLAGIGALLLCLAILVFLASQWPIDRLLRQTDLLHFPFQGAVMSITTLWLIQHLYVSLAKSIIVRIW